MNPFKEDPFLDLHGFDEDFALIWDRLFKAVSCYLLPSSPVPTAGTPFHTEAGHLSHTKHAVSLIHTHTTQRSLAVHPDGVSIYTTTQLEVIALKKETNDFK